MPKPIEEDEMSRRELANSARGPEQKEKSGRRSATIGDAQSAKNKLQTPLRKQRTWITWNREVGATNWQSNKNVKN